MAYERVKTSDKEVWWRQKKSDEQLCDLLAASSFSRERELVACAEQKERTLCLRIAEQENKSSLLADCRARKSALCLRKEKQTEREERMKERGREGSIGREGDPELTS